MKKKILKLIGALWTIFGLVYFLLGWIGGQTDIAIVGLLAMILGELIDAKKER